MGHLHAELCLELLAGLLRIVCTVEIVAGDGALSTRHVTANDEVSGAEVLADDHVLDGLAGAGHLHAVGQVGPAEHRVLLLGLLAQGLVGLDTHDAIDVARLRGAACRVHQEDGICNVALCALQELEVGTVNRVAVLEGDDFLALRQCRAYLRRRHHWVLELGALEAVHLATDIVLALLGDQGVDGGVLEAGGAEALLGLDDLIRFVDGRHLQHSNLLALPLQQDLVAPLQTRNALHIEGHRQAEQLLLGQAHVLHDGVVGGLIHEALERAEGTVHEAEHIASLALVQIDGPDAGTLEGLGLRSILDDEVLERTSVRRTGGRGAGVDATLGLRLSDEAAGALALVGLDRHRGVRVTERLEDVGDGGRRGALDLGLCGLPEGLPEGNLLPRKVREVPLRGLDGSIAPVCEVVARIHRDTLRVGILDDVLPAEAGHRVQSALALLPDVKGNALCSLIHATASDEDVLVALCQGALEGLDLAHKVEVGRVHLLAVAILCDELVQARHIRRHLPQPLLAVLLLDLLGAHQR
mmetsp:Transcript_133441/g.426595  ORF Transcript_133441/g.426595 Transcript_133441/m.426595 type:complete len:527 (-) Transcript_133441:352-1932(-)